MASSSEWPELKGKAHNCFVVLTWLSSWVKQRASVSNHHKLVDTCLLAHGHYHKIMRAAGPKFTIEQGRSFHEAGLVMLRSYTLLSKMAHLDKAARWQVKPKHHHLWHGFESAKQTLANPRSHWLFKHEDLVIKIMKQSKKTNKIENDNNYKTNQNYEANKSNMYT